MFLNFPAEVATEVLAVAGEFYLTDKRLAAPQGRLIRLKPAASSC